MFQGPRRGFALNLDNMVRREVMPLLGDARVGWKPFRAGIATTLFDCGTDPEVAALILRHSGSTMTRRHYIRLQTKKQAATAMRRFSKMVKAGVSW